MDPMRFRPRAITLDLDDTLWPIAPVIERAERVLHDWLLTHAPAAAERFPVAQMRALRDRIAEAHPHLAHDYSAQRMLSLRHALGESGHDPEQAEQAYAVFFAARNEVELYPEVSAALERIAGRVPIAALTNGNADLARTPLAGRFRFQLGAREHGAAKPAASIFLEACVRLDCEPQQVLHVGDDPHLDVLGARQAGLRACWLNRHDAHWPLAEAEGQLQVRDLTALADWLDAQFEPTRTESR